MNAATTASLTLGMLTEPLPWALELIRAATAHGPLPLYGDPEWQQLEPTDPRRWAAVIVAAEAWRDHRSAERIAVELRRELDDIDMAVISRLKEAAVDVASATDWTARASAPTHIDLERRRSLPTRPVPCTTPERLAPTAQEARP
jgi:hypothetical protein